MSSPSSEIQARDPLYRRTFVGRERELGLLQAALGEASASVGGLAMVVGEPGIGKSALCEQLVASAAEHHAKALVGHCYEAGSASLPYMPFVEVLHRYLMESDFGDVRAALGADGAEIARLVPELTERVDIIPRPPGDPADDRWRLLQAVTGLLRRAAIHQPLLLVLEDLHDADRDTLDLLLHLARTLRDARLLVVGTYRDVEVDRVHPLSAALANLHRTGNFLRIGLRGLSVDEVHRMSISLGGQAVPLSRAQAVHQRTEGNPLFVQELLRYLVESGVVARENPRDPPAADPAIEAEVPEGLRDVVGKRLSRLSEETNQLLALASVIGREFRLDVLQRVTSMPEDQSIASLAEAQARAIIDEAHGHLGALQFRFTHAFFRQTLYDEIFAARRIRWHLQIAEALEVVHARHLDEHAAELAEHFAQSADPSSLARTVQYSRMGARRAMRQAAYGEAQRLLRQALQAQDVLDPDDRDSRCDLLLMLGEALLPTENPWRAAQTVADEAFRLAESLGDSHRAARAAVQALEAWFRAGSDSGLLGLEEWIRRANQHAAPGTAERVFAVLYQSLLRTPTSRSEASQLVRQAVEEARELGNDRVFMGAAGHAVLNLRALPDLDLVEDLARQVCDGSRSDLYSVQSALGLVASGRVLLACGDREAAERAWGDLARMAADDGDLTIDLWARASRADLAFVDGRLDEAVAIVDEISALGAQHGLTRGRGLGGSVLLRQISARALYYLGRDPSRHLIDLSGLTARDRGLRRPAAIARALVLSFLGRRNEVMATRAMFGNISSDEDWSGLQVLAGLLEISVRCGDVPSTETLVARLESIAGRLQHDYLISFGRLLGEGAVLLGRPARARDFYAQAIGICEKVRFRPELALTRLDLAELLLVHYPDERKEALAHLEFSMDEFGAMHMQPYLARASELREKYGDVVAPPAAAHTNAVVASRIGPLTAREGEVAAQIARGLSNREIAEALVITESTAEVHVKRILGKLQFKSRSQIATWATQRALVPTQAAPRD
jgi:DNA-binding CsgD family transcriptional regulator